MTTDNIRFGEFTGQNGAAYQYANDLDHDGNPAGGYVYGLGIAVDWQCGPLRNGEPNGAFVEELITCVVNRLRFYQHASNEKFACPENSLAIHHLMAARGFLLDRTAKRKEQGVEGTYEPHTQ